jgi:hypothetical protein
MSYEKEDKQEISGAQRKLEGYAKTNEEKETKK